MTFRDGPEACAPDEFRCEALVEGRKGWPNWSQKDHRCVRRAQASRAGHSVCYTHNMKKEVRFWPLDKRDEFVRYKTHRGIATPIKMQY